MYVYRKENVEGSSRIKRHDPRRTASLVSSSGLPINLT